MIEAEQFVSDAGPSWSPEELATYFEKGHGVRGEQVAVQLRRFRPTNEVEILKDQKRAWRHHAEQAMQERDRLREVLEAIEQGGAS